VLPSYFVDYDLDADRLANLALNEIEEFGIKTGAGNLTDVNSVLKILAFFLLIHIHY
jgi:hypothetical protein